MLLLHHHNSRLLQRRDAATTNAVPRAVRSSVSSRISKRVRQRGSTSAQPQKQQHAPAAGSSSNSSSHDRAARALVRQLADAATVQHLAELLAQGELQQQGGVLNQYHVATAYSRLGRLCQIDPALAQSSAAMRLLQHLDLLLPSVQRQLDAAGLASGIWCCGHTQHAAGITALLPAFLQPHIQATASPQHIGNVLWALATMQQELPPRQLQLMVGSLVKQLGQADPHSMCMTLCAVAKMRRQQLPQVQRQVQQLLRPQVQLLLEALARKVDRLRPPDISNSLWPVADMGLQVGERQLQLMLAALTRQLHTAKPQEVSNTLVACVSFRHLPAQLLSALEQQQHLPAFLAAADTQALSNTAWACGQLGHQSSTLIPGLVQESLLRLQQDRRCFIPQALCNLCWAVAVADRQELVPAVLQLAATCADLLDGETVGARKDLQQLHQVHIWLLQLPRGDITRGLTGVLSQQQLQACAACWRALRASAKTTQLQQQVLDSLLELPASTWQTAPAMERPSSDGNFSIDVAAVTADGVQVAIEADGPWHYVSPGRRFNGPTKFRNRMLAAQGHTVVSIPYWEWDVCRTDEQRQRYLTLKLAGGFISGAGCGVMLVPSSVLHRCPKSPAPVVLSSSACCCPPA